MYLATTISPLLTKTSLDLFYKKGKGYYLAIVTFFYSSLSLDFPANVSIQTYLFQIQQINLPLCNSVIKMRYHVYYSPG